MVTILLNPGRSRNLPRHDAHYCCKEETISATFQLAGVALSASGNQARAAAPVLQSTFDVCCGFAIIPGDCTSDTGTAAQIPS